MRSLEANKTNKEGVGGLKFSPAPRATAIGLIAKLDAVDVLGPQMFERDCLGYTFDLWSRSMSGIHTNSQEQVSADDVLADIRDIRDLPTRHREVREVDVDLLSAIAAIETYVLEHRPTLQ